MIADYSVPPGLEPSGDESAGAGRWSPTSIRRLATEVATTGWGALRQLSDEALFEAWCATIDELLDPQSTARRSLDPGLAAACRLTPPALDAALEAMLTGFTGQRVRQLIQRYEPGTRDPGRLAVAVLAANVPGLAVQVVLPALVARRPLLVKSSSREPWFAAVLVQGLANRSPQIAQALAAVAWPGGEADLEEPVLAIADRLVAYGRADTLENLRGRFAGRLAALGPKLSIAVVSRDADEETTGRALARDVALFEQRGCLSLQTVLTDGNPHALATALAEGLTELAALWPPPPLEPELAARLQQLRQVAGLAGEEVSDLPLRTGTVLTASASSGTEAAIRPLPGGRTVRVVEVRHIEQVQSAIAPLRGAIQGAALAGEAAWRLAPALGAAGLTRLAAPGELQQADALWANGEQHLADFFRG